MLLTNAQYGTFNSVMNDLHTVIAVLQPGVEEISRKYGSQPAKRLSLLLNKLHHLQRDALKYTYFHQYRLCSLILSLIDQGPVSGRILSLETDLHSLITLVTIVFSLLKITRGLKIF